MLLRFCTRGSPEVSGESSKDQVIAIKNLNKIVEVFSVLEAGIEPARPKTQDFESSASTNSATRANGTQK